MERERGWVRYLRNPFQPGPPGSKCSCSQASAKAACVSLMQDAADSVG